METYAAKREAFELKIEELDKMAKYIFRDNPEIRNRRVVFLASKRATIKTFKEITRSTLRKKIQNGNEGNKEGERHKQVYKQE